MLDTVLSTEKMIKDNLKKAFRVQNLVVFSLAFFGLAGLGLMNFANLSYDPDAIGVSFLLYALFQVISYGSIISSFSTRQLQKRKTFSTVLTEVTAYVSWVSKYYRREYLDKCVYTYNMKTKKEAYLSKYQNKLKKLLDKKDKVEYHRAWKLFSEYPENKGIDGFKFKHTTNEKENVKFLNYCLKRQDLEERIKNVDIEYEDEFVSYDKLHADDLIVSISKNQNQRVPRGTEGEDIGLGVGKQMVIMFSLSIVLSLLVISRHENWIDATIKTLLTVFFVFLSALKGINNGDRVFENTTLVKEMFRKNRLHEYVIYEATENSYVLPKEEGE